MRLIVFVVALASLSCGRTRLVNPTPEDAAFDGTFDRFDTGRFDTGRFDTGRFDTGDSDADPSSGLLIDQLTCGLDEDEILAAAARYTSCNDDGLTMQGIVESWEALALGTPGFAPATIGLPSSCDVWRCNATATSCRSARTCLDDAALDGAPCMDGNTRCIGDDSAVCEDGRWLLDVSCAAFGASCVDSMCVTAGGCEFAGFGAESTSCDGGNVSLCGTQADCGDFNGGACAAFFLGGEVPVVWCSPDGSSASGGVSQPVSCNPDNGRVRFATLTDTTYGFRCLDFGYAGCDDRGCTR